MSAPGAGATSGAGQARPVAAIFPGQGSQRVGMGRELYDASAAAREVLDRAERALPGLLNLMWEGPEDQLQLTANQQPALVAAGAAAYAAYLEAGGAPAVVGAGHSLGEYTALVAAGSLALEDAVRLVRARGQYMQDAVPAGAGAMAAVLKLDAGEIERVVRDVSGAAGGTGTHGSLLEDTPGQGERELLVEIANYNAPGQTVISGSAAGVQEAGARLKELGARVVPLKVSAPFHCSLMKPAAERLAVDLRNTAFGEPSFPVVCNVTAEPLPAPSAAPGLLEAQVTGSVRWVECVQRLAATPGGPPRFLEFGSGEVLVNLVKRILSAEGEGAPPTASAVFDTATLEEVTT